MDIIKIFLFNYINMTLFNFINTDPYIYAIVMILSNIGSRYIEIDLDFNHKEFLSSKTMRRIMIFIVAFMATRNIIVALIITSLFVIIILNLLNYNSPYCILSKKQNLNLNNNETGVTDEELKQAYLTLKKAGKNK